MKVSIGVIGAGSFGTALAKLLGEKGHDVRLWVFEEDLCERMQKTRVNDVYLPGVKLPPNVTPVRELRDTMEGLRRVLVPGMGGVQIPLEQLAKMRYVRGPQVIKSEDTFLIGYV